MRKKSNTLSYIKAAIIGLYLFIIAAGIFYVYKNNNAAVLNPEGMIASEQLSLMGTALGLMALVVVPVLIMTFWIAWKYRAGNRKAKHSPDWDSHHLLEGLWWGIPFVIIAILAVITYFSSHALDPYKPLEHDKPGVNVQVVALQWRWMFIYPDYEIATINDLRFPENTPVNFTITSDAPMNSFWIPSLGGQVYAMSGMSTKLHLIADKTGIYNGLSANISGEGFSDMKFEAQSLSDIDFRNWIQTVKSSGKKLDSTEYEKLVPATHDTSVHRYVLTDRNLYDKIIMKYMPPDNGGHDEKKMEGHN